MVVRSEIFRSKDADAVRLKKEGPWSEYDYKGACEWSYSLKDFTIRDSETGPSRKPQWQ
jgi:hypothetical protein